MSPPAGVATGLGGVVPRGYLNFHCVEFHVWCTGEFMISS